MAVKGNISHRLGKREKERKKKFFPSVFKNIYSEKYKRQILKLKEFLYFGKNGIFLKI